jgi:hypothetical protein
MKMIIHIQQRKIPSPTLSHNKMRKINIMLKENHDKNFHQIVKCAKISNH